MGRAVLNMISAATDFRCSLEMFGHGPLGDAGPADFTLLLCESNDLAELRWPADAYPYDTKIDQGDGWQHPPLRYGVPAIMDLVATKEVVWDRG